MKKHTIALALAVSFTALTAAHAEVATQGRLERSIQFTADANGFDAEAVAYRRDKLKATTKTQGDFNLANRFTVEIDGLMVGGVYSVEGFESDSDIVEYKEGEGGSVHTRPGNHKPGKVTITKAWSSTSEFTKWRKAVLDGKVERKSISVISRNDAGTEAGRVQASGCYPVQLLTSESPLERDKASRTEVTVLDCTDMKLKSMHDTTMDTILNLIR